MRRTLLKTMLLAWPLAMLSRGADAATDATATTASAVHVVYHFADGRIQAARGLANIRNHLRADPGVKIVVVALADGIRLVLKDEADDNGHSFSDQVTALAGQGVSFRICGNTLSAHQVALTRVLPEAIVVPSGVAELARLQAREGYVYIRP